MEDILSDSIALFGDEIVEDESIRYGPLVLTTAPKVRLSYSSDRGTELSLSDAARQGNAHVPIRQHPMVLICVTGKYVARRSPVFALPVVGRANRAWTSLDRRQVKSVEYLRPRMKILTLCISGGAWSGLCTAIITCDDLGKSTVPRRDHGLS